MCIRVHILPALHSARGRPRLPQHPLDTCLGGPWAQKPGESPGQSLLHSYPWDCHCCWKLLSAQDRAECFEGGKLRPQGSLMSQPSSPFPPGALHFPTHISTFLETVATPLPAGRVHMVWAPGTRVGHHRMEQEGHSIVELS